MLMAHTSPGSGSGLGQFAPEATASQAFVLVGRILTLMTVLLIAVMPLTEHFWGLDTFLRGGQDFEFDLLAIMTMLCLIIVLSAQRRQGVNLFLAIQQWLSLIFQCNGLAPAVCKPLAVITTLPLRPQWSRGFGEESHPLLI
jgi:hypothetical protein